MQEKIDINVSLGDFVAKYPKARKVFEKYGFDYCCGGKKIIKTAAEEKNFDLNTLILELEKAISESDEEAQEQKSWVNESLSDIAGHIIEKHHGFLRKELPYTNTLLDKVTMVHGPKHGELLNNLSAKYSKLRESLEEHLDKEEQLLFPVIKELEAVEENKKPVENKEKLNEIIESFYSEHDEAGDLLEQIRNLTSNFTLPQDACESFKTLYENLAEIEDDLHKHIHLENNILLPRVQELLKKNI